ncbi:efflux transporter outer membrane subunit [Caulobacter sp. 17J80-11]|uniref:efflux transporter outer membrane subunit n=1 Tax=Caulobacter sp. 17J80-11 TaxID=2763502 RepID=UPI001653AAFE|nr:efflux transporter outer membrane subunit [Caulobacter sp. 17J80-11]MBC6980353.1 efflux transporter outer membrane subunit [Caulobacter sp. 17J80-11]
MKARSPGVRTTTRLAASAAALLVTVSSTGCRTVGPDYKRPEATYPAEFRGQTGTTAAGSIAEQPWQSVFTDPALQALITDALANNHDLEIAAARVQQAQALVGIVESQGGPQLDYQTFLGTQQTLTPEPNDIGTARFAAIGGALNASWEIDLWGRIRRQTEAAEANLYAQQYVARGVVLSLVSEVASGYFRLLTLDRELEIAQESQKVYGRTLDLFTLRFDAGKDSKLPVERASSGYQASQADVEDLKRAIAQQENALSVLLGVPPRAIARGRPLDQQIAPPTPVGATSEVLQRRPDILRAEQEMIRANAEIGVAVANYFPRVGLSALLGGDIVHFEGDTNSFGLWNLALNAAGPIFTSGRLEEAYNLRRAFWDQSVAEYRKTVLTAFQETSDALAAQDTLGRQRTALERQVASLRESMDLALLRYDGGRASYFEVLEAEQQLFPAEDALARTKRDQLLAVVNLYKALGGGWHTAAPAAGINTASPAVPPGRNPSNPPARNPSNGGE